MLTAYKWTLEKNSTMNEIWTKVTAGCRNWKSSIFSVKGIRASPSSVLKQHYPSLLKTFCGSGVQSFQTLNVRGFFPHKLLFLITGIRGWVGLDCTRLPKRLMSIFRQVNLTPQLSSSYISLNSHFRTLKSLHYTTLQELWYSPRQLQPLTGPFATGSLIEKSVDCTCEYASLMDMANDMDREEQFMALLRLH